MRTTQNVCLTYSGQPEPQKILVNGTPVKEGEDLVTTSIESFRNYTWEYLRGLSIMEDW